MKEYKAVSVPDFGTESKKAENVILSEVTKNLVKCQAALADLYNYVADNVTFALLESTSDPDPQLASFDEAYSKLDDEIFKLINLVVCRRLIDSDYKEL